MKRLTVEVDLDALSLPDLRRVGDVLGKIEEFAEKGLLHLDVKEVKSTPGKRFRTDKKTLHERSMQPQERTVLSTMLEHGGDLTSAEWAERAGIQENSIRHRLRTLQERGLITSSNTRPMTWVAVTVKD